MSYTLGAKNTQEGLLEINFKVDSKKFNEFILEAYKKNKNRFNIPGFRKGHAPFKMVEQTYGKAALYNDAIEIAFSSEYAEFLKKADKAMLDTILSRPSAKKIDISDNEELILDVEVAITPDVTLGEYTGLNIKRKDSKASEKEINDKIQQVRDDASKFVNENKKAKKGDELVFDFCGKVDGKEFEGGKAEDYRLVLGSNMFIPGFEDQLVGTSAGEKKDVKVKFPDDYHAEDLKGKDAVFECNVKEVFTKIMPKLDDEFAKQVSSFDTFEKYKKSVEEELSKAKQKESDNEFQKELIEKIIAKSKVNVPQILVDQYTEERIYQMEQQYNQNNFSFDMYLKYMGMTLDEFKNRISETIKNDFKLDFILDAIIVKEKIKPTAKEQDKIMEEYAKKADKDLETYKKDLKDYELNFFEDSAKRKKVVEFLEKNNEKKAQ